MVIPPIIFFPIKFDNDSAKKRKAEEDEQLAKQIRAKKEKEEWKTQPTSKLNKKLEKKYGKEYADLVTKGKSKRQQGD